MPTELVKVGNHLFGKAQLEQVLADTVPSIKPGHSRAIAATVDADGAKVGVVIGSADGHWTVKGAAQHDWDGDTKAAGSVLFSW